MVPVRKLLVKFAFLRVVKLTKISGGKGPRSSLLASNNCNTESLLLLQTIPYHPSTFPTPPQGSVERFHLLVQDPTPFVELYNATRASCCEGSSTQRTKENKHRNIHANNWECPISEEKLDVQDDGFFHCYPQDRLLYTMVHNRKIRTFVISPESFLSSSRVG